MAAAVARVARAMEGVARATEAMVAVVTAVVAVWWAAVVMEEEATARLRHALVVKHLERGQSERPEWEFPFLSGTS